MVSIADPGQVVQDKFDQRSVSTARASEKIVDLVASGELFEMASGPVGVAIGGQFRDVVINSIPDSLESAGEANEEGLEATVRGRQDVLAFFVLHRMHRSGRLHAQAECIFCHHPHALPRSFLS